jgi:Domain of unknown function (DUF4268)
VIEPPMGGPSVPVPPKPLLGRLERVELRAVWLFEGRDFTPWLAREDNIALLSDAIGLDLAVESTEKGVGPYRADILCKDTGSGDWVLIENQLERTDHIHLGQLLTYAAGLEAATVVWVARNFTEEHRAAMDWLNQITDIRFNFFGLEIELWRISDSPVAPKFNVVSKPNDWSKVVRQAAESSAAGNLSENQQLHLDFWTQFKQFMDERNNSLRVSKPSTDYWQNVSLGRGAFLLSAQNGMRDGRSSVMLWIGGPQKQAFYHLLLARKSELEQLLGFGALKWEELPKNKESHVVLVRTSRPTDRSTWPELDLWFAQTLEKMHAVFGPIIRDLNPAQFIPPDAEIDGVVGGPLDGDGQPA